MEEQLAFYSIVLNWSFNDNQNDIECEQNEIKTNHNNYNNENTNHNSMLTDDISEPPLKKRKMSTNIEPPPPLEPTTTTNTTPPPTTTLNNEPLSPLDRIPKISNNNNNLIEQSIETNGEKKTKQKKKFKKFKRAVTLKSSKNNNNQINESDFDKLFPVSKFLNGNGNCWKGNNRTSSLLSICTFPNILSYKEHFGSLLFDDLYARLNGQINESIVNNYKNGYDILPASLINDIGHNEYICCSFQILSSLKKSLIVNNKMLVLIIYGNGNGNNKILGIIDEQPSLSHIKIQIHLLESDERYEHFISCFDTEKIKRNSMKIIFLDNIQNRMREFRAICNVHKLRLKNIIINPKNILLQNKLCCQKSNEFVRNNDEFVWKYVPDAYRKRLGRYLNSSQCKAIEKACQNKGITLLQGPPGTGKTRTVLHLMNAFHIAKTQAMFESWLKTMYNKFHNSSQNNNKIEPINKPKILVLAPSNAAVDEIIIRLMDTQFVDGNDFKYRPPITRIGNMEKCRIEVGKQVSLYSKVDAFLQHKNNLKNLNDRIRFFQNQKHECESKLNEFIKQRLALFNQINDFELFKSNESTQKIIQFLQQVHTATKELQRLLWVKTLSKKSAKDRLIISILMESEIIFTTLNSSGGRELRLLYEEFHDTYTSLLNYKHNLFDHCIIDEAGQCTEPDILIPLQYDIDSVILVGDPQQLPATVFCNGPSAWLYQRSLFERLMNNAYPVHLLNTQYRMHPEIAFFPNIHFYNDKLKNGNNVLGPKYILNFHQHISQLYKPFLFFNIHSSNEKRNLNNKSLYNKYEIEFILQHLQSFYFDNHDIDSNNLKIGIITPYKQQQLKLLEAIKYYNNGILYNKNIEVATVDFYQGREKDIIIFSCVRAGGINNNIGFLSDIRRMNVAITRAKYSLWIVGNINKLSKNPDWKSLIKYAKDKKCMKLIKYNQKTKQYKLINGNTLKNKQLQQQKVKSMPMIIDYGDMNLHNQHIIQPQPPPLPPPQHQYRQHLTPHPSHPQIIHPHLPPLPPPQHLHHPIPPHPHIIHPNHNHNHNHTFIHNNHPHIHQHNNIVNNNNGLIDYTRTHMNSSAFDD